MSPGYVSTGIQERGLDGQGNILGINDRDESQHTMSIEDCTSQIMKGILRRQREVVMTPTGKLLKFYKLVAPKLVDYLAAKEAAR